MNHVHGAVDWLRRRVHDGPAGGVDIGCGSAQALEVAGAC
jgi:hypothetical protein